MRIIAMIIALAVAGIAGWGVYSQLTEIVPQQAIHFGGSGIAGLLVFLLLYFPLGRPIADVINDRIAALSSRARDSRVGTGIGDIPVAGTGRSGKLVTCQFCGAPGAVVCAQCQLKMSSK